MFALLDKAAELYRARAANDSERGKEYFKKRGLTGDTAARFALGYAPDAWDTVLQQLGASEADRSKLLQVGLVIERERKAGVNPGYYDRFRDRVMFPIRDARGRTIGFGGRVLDKGEPKYLNSPETELFHKGQELYGLYEARQASRTLTRLLIVEGYMDVVRLHQAGITYAVATLGTATTPEHFKRVFKICQEVIFCFDGDRAGRAAAWRALENSLSQVREGRQIRFLFLPDGHDPDSLVGAEGREAFEARVGNAEALSRLPGQASERAERHGVRDGRATFQEMAKPYAGEDSGGRLPRQLLTAINREAKIDTRPAGCAAGTGKQLAAARRVPCHRWAGNLVRQAVQLAGPLPPDRRQGPRSDGFGVTGTPRNPPDRAARRRIA